MATSIVKAEYISLSSAAKHGIWLRNLFSELRQAKYLGRDPLNPATALPVIIFCDSQGAIALTDNPKKHAQMKHIDIQYHYMRYLLTTGQITIAYCPTNNMLADILMKPLPKVSIQWHLRKIFG